MHSPEPAAEIVTEESQVNQRLRRIGLTREIVRAVAEAAAGARADALAVDPHGTPGQLSYIHGVRAIRLNLLPLEGWRESRVGNVESTVNDKLGVRICFQNVDRACGEAPPLATCGKGSASRDLIQTGLFDNVSNHETGLGKIGHTPTVWFICVSVNGDLVHAEVSCPKHFEGNQFDGFDPRLFVIVDDAAPKHSRRRHDNDDDDGDIEVDVQVTKK